LFAGALDLAGDKGWALAVGIVEANKKIRTLHPSVADITPEESRATLTPITRELNDLLAPRGFHAISVLHDTYGLGFQTYRATAELPFFAVDGKPVSALMVSRFNDLDANDMLGYHIADSPYFAVIGDETEKEAMRRRISPDGLVMDIAIHEIEHKFGGNEDDETDAYLAQLAEGRLPVVAYTFMKQELPASEYQMFAAPLYPYLDGPLAVLQAKARETYQNKNGRDVRIEVIGATPVVSSPVTAPAIARLPSTPQDSAIS
jgi:hypothetical protein